MKRKSILPSTFAVLVFLMGLASFMLNSCGNAGENNRIEKTNIVIIYADDLGYADVGCYGAIGVETPNIDALAAGGMKFTDAHCSAATCTPSRFSLLTGTYAFRNKAAILPGDAPLLIRPGTPTIVAMLQSEGYRTAVVGKWHLGLGDGAVDWNGEISPGPAEIGFDYHFLLPATGDRVPCVFVEDGFVVGLDPNDPIEVSYSEMIGDLPTGLAHPEMLKVKADTQHSQTIINGVSRIGTMSGGEAAWWKDEEFADVFTGKAIDFIRENRDQPFFLYFSFHDIHVPRMPNPRFKGLSTMGSRGDAIVQMDWCVGEIMKTLEDLDLSGNTLVIFSSDNGPVLNDGYSDGAEELVGAHNPSGPFRGGKYSAFEAGTRVPTITYWPGVIEQGESDALLSQVDLYASLAELAGHEPGPDEGPDSQSLLPAWLGQTRQGRERMIEESFTLSLRDGEWKYIAPAMIQPEWMKNKNIESGLGKENQLYNLSEDIGEKHNLAEDMPDKVQEMEGLLQDIIDNPVSLK